MLNIDVFDQALSRGPSDCAICMIPLAVTLTNPTSTHLIFPLPVPPSSNQQNPNGANATTTIATNKKCILLSCTHIFHDSCISSFERFSRSEVSPFLNLDAFIEIITSFHNLLNDIFRQLTAQYVEVSTANELCPLLKILVVFIGLLYILYCKYEGIK